MTEFVLAGSLGYVNLAHVRSIEPVGADRWRIWWGNGNSNEVSAAIARPLLDRIIADANLRMFLSGKPIGPDNRHLCASEATP